MEFWGVEVKAGKPLKCDPGPDKYVHLTQASLGGFNKEKENEPILLYVKVGDQKLVLGMLFSENCAHMSFDLVFEKEFELSHSWKNGSVHFCGYKTIIQDESDVLTDTDSDEDIPIMVKGNGKPEAKEEKVKLAYRKKADEDGDDVDEDESDDEDMLLGESDDENDGVDEVTPQKAEPGKKRSAEPATSTPLPEKKAKLVISGGQTTGKPEAKQEKPKLAMDKANAAKPESSAAKKDDDEDDDDDDESDDEETLQGEDQSDDKDAGEDEATPKEAQSDKNISAKPAARTQGHGRVMLASHLDTYRREAYGSAPPIAPPLRPPVYAHRNRPMEMDYYRTMELRDRRHVELEPPRTFDEFQPRDPYTLYQDTAVYRDPRLPAGLPPGYFPPHLYRH